MPQGIDISTTTPITCPVCGHSHFTQELLLRKVSRFTINSASDGIMPVPIFVCSSCKSICEEALAPELQEVVFPKPKISL